MRVSAAIEVAWTMGTLKAASLASKTFRRGRSRVYLLLRTYGGIYYGFLNLGRTSGVVKEWVFDITDILILLSCVQSTFCISFQYSERITGSRPP